MKSLRRSQRRCRISSSARLEILLNSTYILPIVGVEVKGIWDVLVVLRKLRKERKTTFYYTTFNMVEILEKVAKYKYNYDIIYTGLSVIQEEFKLTYSTVKGYLKALKLKQEGFKDLIDLLLYITSLTRNLLFVTRDNALVDFLESLGENLENILYEEEFLEKYSK